MQLEGKIINFLGDSITQGVGTTSCENTFHYLIKKKYNVKYAYNCGVGGTRIARHTVPSMDAIYDLYFELRAETMDKNADLIVVFGGTNDYGHGDALFGDVDSDDICTFCGAVNSLISKLERDFPKAEIVFMTPLHRIGEEVPSKPEGKILEDYVNAIRTICKKRGIALIDLFEMNPLDPNDKVLVPDGLHPSDAGHKIMAEVIGEELIKI